MSIARSPGGEPGADKIAEVSPALDLGAFRHIIERSGLGNLRYKLKQL